MSMFTDKILLQSRCLIGKKICILKDTLIIESYFGLLTSYIPMSKVIFSFNHRIKVYIKTEFGTKILIPYNPFNKKKIVNLINKLVTKK